MSAETFIERLNKSVENLVTLEIITAVGTVQVTPRDADGKKPDLKLAEGAKILRTRISLLQGDITTEIDPEYVTGAYQGLRDFHAAREKQGAEIIKANIEALVSLFKLIESRVPALNKPNG